MPASRKPATRTTTSTARKRTAAEPAALKRLNKSLDDPQKALVALRKDVGKDISRGARDLYSDNDLEALQKRLAASDKPASHKRRSAGRSTTAEHVTSGRARAKRG